MALRPIIIKNPKLLLVPYNGVGGALGTPVDVSPDVTAVAIDLDQDISTIKTFAGTFKVPGDAEAGMTFSVIIGPDTETNWNGLIGAFDVEARIYDTATSTRYRRVRTAVTVNPSLYGATDVDEETRTVDMDMPVYEGPTWVAVV